MRSKKEPSIYEYTPGKPFNLKADATFHLYISQPSCGDASMLTLLEGQSAEVKEINENKKRVFEESVVDPKKRRKDADGREKAPFAPVLPPLLLAARAKGEVLRGREEYARKVYLSTITIGDRVDLDSMQRAVVDRLEGLKAVEDLPIPFAHNKTRILELDPSSKPITSHTGIVWFHAPMSQPEVIVEGRKQGYNARKGVWSDASKSQVCKQMLLRTGFMKLVTDEFLPDALKGKDLKSMTYHDLKEHAHDYCAARDLLLEHEKFKGWVVTSDFFEFSIRSLGFS
ncbi:hypothetical protein HK101_009861 [Irineochytrium annulatum]|nr:hypothetical protein HK101_009861 [Irineochytrium annulatum]